MEVARTAHKEGTHRSEALMAWLCRVRSQLLAASAMSPSSSSLDVLVKSMLRKSSWAANPKQNWGSIQGDRQSAALDCTCISSSSLLRQGDHGDDAVAYSSACCTGYTTRSTQTTLLGRRPRCTLKFGVRLSAFLATPYGLVQSNNDLIKSTVYVFFSLTLNIWDQIVGLF